MDKINPLTQVAALAAMRDCDEHLIHLHKYQNELCESVVQFFKEHIPAVDVHVPQGTCLMWLDFSALFATAAEAEAFCVDAGTHLYSGAAFGAKGVFLRLNAGS